MDRSHDCIFLVKNRSIYVGESHARQLQAPCELEIFVAVRPVEFLVEQTYFLGGAPPEPDIATMEEIARARMSGNPFNLANTLVQRQAPLEIDGTASTDFHQVLRRIPTLQHAELRSTNLLESSFVYVTPAVSKTTQRWFYDMGRRGTQSKSSSNMIGPRED